MSSINISIDSQIAVAIPNHSGSLVIPDCDDSQAVVIQSSDGPRLVAMTSEPLTYLHGSVTYFLSMHQIIRLFRREETKKQTEEESRMHNFRQERYPHIFFIITPQKHIYFAKVLLMSTHNIYFCGEIRTIQQPSLEKQEWHVCKYHIYP